MKAVIKKLLKERLLDRTSEEHIDLLDRFIDFTSKYLGVDKPKIVLQYNRDGLTTTAAYAAGKIQVYAKERAIVDIMRSIAHEMTHLKQDAENHLESDKHEINNAAGSEIENEANSKAGEIIRKFGKKYPEIYI
jgi:hypothetical protein